VRGEPLQEGTGAIGIAKCLDHFFHTWEDLAHPLVRYDIVAKLSVYHLKEEAAQERWRVSHEFKRTEVIVKIGESSGDVCVREAIDPFHRLKDRPLNHEE